MKKHFKVKLSQVLMVDYVETKVLLLLLEAQLCVSHFFNRMILKLETLLDLNLRMTITQSKVFPYYTQVVIAEVPHII